MILMKVHNCSASATLLIKNLHWFSFLSVQAKEWELQQREQTQSGFETKIWQSNPGNPFTEPEHFQNTNVTKTRNPIVAKRTLNCFFSIFFDRFLFSSIFLDFPRSSSISSIFVDFPRFSSIFLDLSQSSSIFLDFRWSFWVCQFAKPWAEDLLVHVWRPRRPLCCFSFWKKLPASWVAYCQNPGCCNQWVGLLMRSLK